MRNWITLIERNSISAPLYLYHGTDPDNRESILKTGLDPEHDTSWQEFGEGVYLTDDISTARNYGSCVFRVVVSDLDHSRLVPDDQDLSAIFRGELIGGYDPTEFGYDPEEAPSGIHECSWLDSLKIVQQCQYLGHIAHDILKEM